MTFTMWSFGHYLFIFSPIVFTVLLHYLTKQKTHDEKRMIGIYLSLLAVVILLLRNIEIFIVRGYRFDFEIVPLQICHFANFVLLYAFYKESKPFFSLAFTLNLLAAFLSIVFADGLENYTTLISFRGFAYIVGHAMIVIITSWAFLNGFIKINWKTYLQTLKIMFVLYVLSVIVNNLFRIVLDERSNYFYTEHPEAGTPLEWFYNLGTTITVLGFELNPIYLVTTGIFGAVVTLIFFMLSIPLQKRIKY